MSRERDWLLDPWVNEVPVTALSAPVDEARPFQISDEFSDLAWQRCSLCVCPEDTTRERRRTGLTSANRAFFHLSGTRCPSYNDRMPTQSSCPCGSGHDYVVCCGPIIRGDLIATTALQLMRSRYSAYARQELEHLMRTVPCERRTAGERDRIALSLPHAEWLNLTILEVVDGSLDDAAGIVEFQATCSMGGSVRVMRERSSFEKVNGEWLYVSGEFLEPLSAAHSHDESCSCDSGQKARWHGGKAD